MHITLTALFISAAISTLNTINIKPIVAENRQEIIHEQGYIFIGDSRTVGLSAVSQELVPENTQFIFKVGAGIDFLPTAIESLDTIIAEKPDIDWTIICNLGVNDLHNARKYATEYQNMQEKYQNFYCVSVNPVIENESHFATNELIEKFNETLQDQKLNYIDVYSKIENNFQAPDGLHYSQTTYEEIIKIIIDEIETKEK